jgi:hypothetical protein
MHRSSPTPDRDRPDALSRSGYLILDHATWLFASLDGADLVPIDPKDLLDRLDPEGQDTAPPCLGIDVISWAQAEAFEATEPSGAVNLALLLWDGRRLFAPHAASGSFVALGAAHAERLCRPRFPDSEALADDEVARSLRLLGLAPDATDADR